MSKEMSTVYRLLSSRTSLNYYRITVEYLHVGVRISYRDLTYTTSPMEANKRPIRSVTEYHTLCGSNTIIRTNDIGVSQSSVV